MNRNDAMALAGVGLLSYFAYRTYQAKNAYRFQDKTVLITGARGLGLVLARQLAREKARLVICARDPEEVKRAFEDLANRGACVIGLTCDLRDRYQVQKMVQKVRARFGAIDVLINNAGTIGVGPVETMTLDDFHNSLDTNFWAALYTILEVLPEMKARRHGRIVNITSIGGKVSIPHLLPYCTSKFALVGLSEGLRAEVAKDGVVVTTVCPGLMRTGSPRNVQVKGQHRAEYAIFDLLDSLPGISISAESAAKQIIEACRHGDSEVVLSPLAKCVVFLHGIFPGLTTDVNALVNRLLPGVGGIGKRSARGYESESAFAPSLLTHLSDVAAVENNEMVAGSPPPVPATP